MTAPHVRPSTVAAGCALALVLASGVAVASARGVTTPPGADAGGVAEAVLTSEGVEVATHGVVRFPAFQSQGGADVVMAVHAVQRVEGGTVVYVSMGYDGEALPNMAELEEVVGTQIGGRYGGGGGLTSVRVVDRVAGETLSTVREPGDGVLAGALSTKVTAYPSQPRTMYAMYAVVPELEVGTEQVDVTLGLGRTVPDVPVGEGVLEPALPADAPLVLGEGWPEVDLDAVAQAPEPELSRYPLTQVSRSSDGDLTTSESPESVTVDVAADVLFAFDEAELSAEAREVLVEVGDRIGAEAVGSVAVIGHTDSQGSDAYNDDLSLRRAQAVAEVLRPVAEEAGLELVVEGRGEREPVADNGSEEGRAENRRVSISFGTTAAEEGAR